MIVVEGPDGAGKTMLATRLSEALGVSIEPKAVSNEARALVDMKEWVETAISQGFGLRLYDRFSLISELVYSPAMDKAWKPPHQNQSWLSNSLARFYGLEPFIIYCLPSFDLVWRNVAKDHTSWVVQNQAVMQRVYKLYQARIAIDLTISQGTIRVWDYEHDEGTGYFESLVTQIEVALGRHGIHANAR